MGKPKMRAHTAVPHLADGGLVSAIKQRMFGPAETISERYARQDAERAARAPQPAPTPPAQAPEPRANPLNARAVLEQRERAAGLADGGFPPKAELVEGPGTGTSDSIPATVDENTYVLPADSTDVMLSNGETAFPPETLAAIGAAVLEILREATHVPVEEDPAALEPVVEEEPIPGFADGGLVDERPKPNSFGDAAAASRDATIQAVPTSTVSTTPLPPVVNPPTPAPAVVAPTSPRPGPMTAAAAVAPPMTMPAPAPAAAAAPAAPEAGAGRGFGYSAPVVPGSASEQLSRSAAQPSVAGFDAGGPNTAMGFGIRRIDGGSSPLFTNLSGMDGEASNQALMSRRPMSAQDSQAFDRLGARQAEESLNRVRAGATQPTYTNGPVAAGPDTGGFGILDRTYQAKRDATFNSPETNRNINEMAKRSNERMVDATMRRGQDFDQTAEQGRQQLGTNRLGFDVSNANATQALARQRLGFDYYNTNASQEGQNARAALAYAGDVDKARITASGKSTAPTGYRWGPDQRSLEVIPGGPAALKAGEAAIGKALPVSAAKGFLDNHRNLQRATDALTLLGGGNIGEAVGDKNATGMKGWLPNAVLERFDPKGVDTRAAIADLGSMVVHDRSGAAVTAAEFPRLAPFIPTASDSPENAAKKLQNFKRVYAAINDDARDFYRASGYNVPDVGGSPAPPPPEEPGVQPRFGARRPAAVESQQAPVREGVQRRLKSQEEFNALPSGTRFRDPEGNLRVKP